MSSHIFSQSNIRLSGQILDAETGFPLTDVAVQVDNTPYGTYSDEDGFFFIENIPPGIYKIQFSLLNYETQSISGVEIVKDFPKRLTIRMISKPLQSDSVIVTAEFGGNESGLEGEKVILTGKDLDRYRQLGLPQLLQQVAGVQVESAGSGNSRSLVRIHGGRSSQVLILLDGQRINNPQTGEVDLSEIPLEQIERIEIIRQGNSALYGGSAFDGVIEFHTRQTPPANFYSMLSKGSSFSSIMGSFTTGLNISGVGGLFNYQQDYSRQDYNYEYEGSTFTRQNAWYRDRKIFGKIGYDFQSRYQLQLLYNYRDGKRGLPCSFFNECGDLSSKMRDRDLALHANQRLILSSKSFIEGMVSYHSLHQIYDNENDPVRINRYKTEQTNQTLEGNLTTKFTAGDFSDIRFGIQYLSETMDQGNLLYPQYNIGEKGRESKAGFSGLELKIPAVNPVWQKAKIFFSIRYEKYFTQSGRWYPTIGISSVPSFWKAINVSASWYKAVRYPDFNSLFWKGDTRARGNPELLPERKTAWTTAIRIRQNQKYFPEVNLHYYSEKTLDMIFWHRSFNGVWEPRNEDQAVKQGLDVELRQNVIPNFVQVQTAYSLIDAVNKDQEPNRYGKQIIFIPQHTLNSSLWIGRSNWQAQIVHRYISERETVPANSKGTQLDAYEILDISGSVEQRIWKMEVVVGFALKNITATNYQLLYGYPMPGREIQFSLTLNFQTPQEAE